MRSAMILLCFLGVVLKMSMSYQFYPLMQRFKFRSSESSSPGWDKQHYGYIVEHNTSSITIVINLDENARNKLVGATVCYRPTYLLYSLPTLEWNQKVRGYTAKESDKIKSDGLKVHCLRHETTSPSLEERIVIGNLQYPGTDYVFDIESYRERRMSMIAQVHANTKFITPTQAPRSGAGCFKVDRVNEDGTRRVMIYWRHDDDLTLKYDVSAYEKGDTKSPPVFTQQGDLFEDVLWTNISRKRHTFIIRSINEAGRSQVFSTVQVPAQKNILPPLSTVVTENKDENTYLLTWKRPMNVRVKNYTVFWYEIQINGQMVVYHRVNDFVYLKRNAKSFKVKAKPGRRVCLAMSVNNKGGSSGFQEVIYGSPDDSERLGKCDSNACVCSKINAEKRLKTIL